MKILSPSYKLDLLELGITAIPVGGLLRGHTTASFQERKGLGTSQQHCIDCKPHPFREEFLSAEGSSSVKIRELLGKEEVSDVNTAYFIYNYPAVSTWAAEYLW